MSNHNYWLKATGANWAQVQHNFRNEHKHPDGTSREWHEGERLGGGGGGGGGGYGGGGGGSPIAADKNAYWKQVMDQYNRSIGYINNAGNQGRQSVGQGSNLAALALGNQYAAGGGHIGNAYSQMQNIAGQNLDNVYGALDEGQAGWEQQLGQNRDAYNQMLQKQRADVLAQTEAREGQFAEQIAPYKDELRQWYDESGEKLRTEVAKQKSESAQFWTDREKKRSDEIDAALARNREELTRYKGSRESGIADARGRAEGIMGEEVERRQALFDLDDQNLKENFNSRMAVTNTVEEALKKGKRERDNLLANSHMYKDGSWGANSTQYVDAETKARQSHALEGLEGPKLVGEMRERLFGERIKYELGLGQDRRMEGEFTEERLAFEDWARQEHSNVDKNYLDMAVALTDAAVDKRSAFMDLSAQAQDSAIRSLGKVLIDKKVDDDGAFGKFIVDVAFKDSEWRNGLTSKFLDTITTLNGVQSQYASQMDQAQLSLLGRLIDKKVDAHNKKADSLTKAEEWRGIQLLGLEQALASGMVTNSHWTADSLVRISQWEADSKANAEGIKTAGLDQIWQMHMDQKNMMINLAQLFS